ncbi:Chaperone protein like [Actinidia chinensis var. chinensis]|uniref:Root meristem growth factor 9 n=2 Tax=Actinidia TaxID=3624 RepID=A0A7J0F666_9ERIC|nr:Chaperone protein like [Actinidia chinensis var. chinensis]GFY94185.1 hypothetical protein Acr_09g0006310 [Actinidia rufa]
MVVLPSKRLLLVAFFLLCFASITAKARSLPKARSNGGAKGDQNDTLTVAQPEKMQPHSHEDLETMDYTPAGKKPPIHN